MLALRVTTANGIDDIHLLGENDAERLFIKQLAESGTLSCISKSVSDSILFRPISVSDDLSSAESSDKKTIGKYDFTVRQNEDFSRDFNFEESGLPLNLTDYTSIKIQIKHSKSAPAIIELSLGSGLEISGDDSNIMLMNIAAAQTKLLSCDFYYYDLLLVKPTATRYFMEGKITVKNTGTR